MNVLIIGGTGFIGPALVRRLQKQGHAVAVFHRGRSTTSLPTGVEQILGDRNRLQDSRAAISRFIPEVVVDFALSSGTQAQQLLDTLRGIAGRIVAISSMDVYRAFAIVHGIDRGPLQPTPLTEDSELRSVPAYPKEQLKRLQSLLTWVTDDYDKVPVEQAVLGCPELPGTVLRLPMVYGPGDYLHRFFPLLKRIDEGRRQITMSSDFAAWRTPRGYVDNVAAAIAAATVSDRACGRVYNIAEQTAFDEFEWAKRIAAVAGWDGEFVIIPREYAPAHLRFPGNLAQQADASSTRIRQELGFREPVRLEEAIRRTIAWERANPPAHVSAEQFDYVAEDAAIAAWQQRTSAA